MSTVELDWRSSAWRRRNRLEPSQVGRDKRIWHGSLRRLKKDRISVCKPCESKESGRGASGHRLQLRLAISVQESKTLIPHGHSVVRKRVITVGNERLKRSGRQP